MGVKISGTLKGLEVTLVHGPSAAVIRTVPPVDNGGDGSQFSPTDLCAASLGACAASVAGLYARRSGIEIDGIEFEVEKEMTASPRRIGRLTVTYRFLTSCSEEDFRKLVNAAKTCPVRLSLGDGVEVVEKYEKHG